MAKWVARTRLWAMGTTTGEPDCDQAQLTLDGNDQIWKGTWTCRPDLMGTGSPQPLVDRELRRQVKEGGNIDFETTDGTVRLLLRPCDHWVTSDEEARSSPHRAPSSQNSVARPIGPRRACDRGCGTRTVTVSTPGPQLIPAGSWNFKDRHGLSPGPRTTATAGARRRRDDGDRPSAGSTDLPLRLATHLTSVTSR